MDRNVVETIGLAVLLVLMFLGVMLFNPFSRNQQEGFSTPTTLDAVIATAGQSMTTVAAPPTEPPDTSQATPTLSQSTSGEMSATPRSTASSSPQAPVSKQTKPQRRRPLAVNAPTRPTFTSLTKSVEQTLLKLETNLSLR